MKYQFHRFVREEQKDDLYYTIPEVTDGFDPHLPATDEGIQPVSYWTAELPMGNYEIGIRLRAHEDIERLYLFTGRKQLRDIITLKRDEVYENKFYQSVSEIIPRYHTHVYREKHLFVTLCADSTETVEVEYCAAQRCTGSHTVYLCGDSIVTDQSCEIPYHPGACYSSWGQDLPAWLGGKYAIQNQAHCGLTTESFRTEGHFDIILNHIEPGDFCLFQFGHNDQKLHHLQADREYGRNLERYICQIREKSGIPVLVTPLGRNIWKSPQEYYDLLLEHAETVRQVADKMGIPCIDLHDASVKFICDCGQRNAQGYFHPGDYTHTNEYGSYLAAEYIARKLAEQFPTEFAFREHRPEFLPPADLWEKLAGGNNRKSDRTEKESFDQMEKSIEELVRTIENVKSGKKK